MNNRSLIICLWALAALTGLQSCTSYKNIPYFKNIPDSTYMYRNGTVIQAQPYEDIKLQPDDILQISITTIDPAVGNNSGISTPLEMVQDPSSTSLTANIGNRAIPGYLIDKEGNIELPMAGKVKVSGLTTAQAREAIGQKASVYYKEPVVNVRLANFKVTVLGEVMRPGNYILASEKATVLDALGLAGDMTIYGRRQNVMLMRREGNNQKVIRMDMNTTDPISSPYYYLRQGDVVYVEPGKGKAAATDASMVRTYGIIASTLSLLVIIASRVKY